MNQYTRWVGVRDESVYKQISVQNESVYKRYYTEILYKKIFVIYHIQNESNYIKKIILIRIKILFLKIFNV